MKTIVLESCRGLLSKALLQYLPLYAISKERREEKLPKKTQESFPKVLLSLLLIFRNAVEYNKSKKTKFKACVFINRCLIWLTKSVLGVRFGQKAGSIFFLIGICISEIKSCFDPTTSSSYQRRYCQRSQQWFGQDSVRGISTTVITTASHIHHRNSGMCVFIIITQFSLKKKTKKQNYTV